MADAEAAEAKKKKNMVAARRARARKTEQRNETVRFLSVRGPMLDSILKGDAILDETARKQLAAMRAEMTSMHNDFTSKACKQEIDLASDEATRPPKRRRKERRKEAPQQQAPPQAEAPPPPPAPQQTAEEARAKAEAAAVAAMAALAQTEGGSGDDLGLDSLFASKSDEEKERDAMKMYGAFSRMMAKAKALAAAEQAA